MARVARGEIPYAPRLPPFYALISLFEGIADAQLPAPPSRVTLLASTSFATPQPLQQGQPGSSTASKHAPQPARTIATIDWAALRADQAALVDAVACGAIRAPVLPPVCAALVAALQSADEQGASSMDGRGASGGKGGAYTMGGAPEGAAEGVQSKEVVGKLHMLAPWIADCVVCCPGYRELLQSCCHGGVHALFQVSFPSPHPTSPACLAGFLMLGPVRLRRSYSHCWCALYLSALFSTARRRTLDRLPTLLGQQRYGWLHAQYAPSPL